MKEKQIIGEQIDIKQSPNTVIRDNFSGGTTQFTGSMAEISRTTVPNGEFNKGISGGRVQMLGDEVDLNRAEHRGWDSFDLKNAKASYNPTSTSASYPKPGKK